MAHCLDLALRLGTLGKGLIATMGNSLEFISAIIALKNCELRVVQSSLVGSILSNLLLVVGLSFTAGGIVFSEQGLGQTITHLNSSLFTLAVISVLLPMAFHFSVDQNSTTNNQPLSDTQQGKAILRMSRGAAIILISLYGCFIFFQIFSHASMFAQNTDVSETVQYPPRLSRKEKKKLKVENAAKADGTWVERPLSVPIPEPDVESNTPEEAEKIPQMNTKMAAAFLVILIGLTVPTLEWLVGSITNLALSRNISKEWVGLILLPLLSGNTAERIESITNSHGGWENLLPSFLTLLSVLHYF